MIEMHTVWPILREIADAAGYSARPAAERAFVSFMLSTGGSAWWLSCMMRCSPGRVLLGAHSAAEVPFIAGDEEYAYIKDWHTRLRHRPADPFGHCLVLVNFGIVGPLLSLNPVGPATAPAHSALEAVRRVLGEIVSARRKGHGAFFLPVRLGI